MCRSGATDRYVSPSLMPIASVAKSGRPILMTTSAISGNCRSRCSIRLLISTDSVSETPGSLRVSTRIEPSSSLRHEFGADEVERAERDSPTR